MGLPQPVGEAFPLEGVSLRPLLEEPSLKLCVHIQCCSGRDDDWLRARLQAASARLCAVDLRPLPQGWGASAQARWTAHTLVSIV